MLGPKLLVASFHNNFRVYVPSRWSTNIIAWAAIVSMLVTFFQRVHAYQSVDALQLTLYRLCLTLLFSLVVFVHC